MKKFAVFLGFVLSLGLVFGYVLSLCVKLLTEDDVSKKEYAVISGMIFSLSTNMLTSDNHKQEKFVNPIFYEKMISATYFTYELQLTPTGIHRVLANGSKYNYNCKLIDNKMDKVSLKCFKYNYDLQKEEMQIFVYRLKPCTEENLCLDKGGWIVSEDLIPQPNFTYKSIYIIPSKSDNAPKDKFINPLFYKKLSPVPVYVGPRFLTPTSRTYFDLDNNKIVEKCEMLENTPMFVTLNCSFYDDEYVDEEEKTRSYIVRYVLQGCDETTKDCYGGKWLVTETIVDRDAERFIIDKKDMGQ